MNYKMILYMVIPIFFFFIGIIVGIFWGTYALIDHVGQVLAGSTFVVNVNETKLIQEFNTTIEPQINKILGNITEVKK